MEWLNYHHLLYFWTVARQGGLTKAAENLRLSPSTVSTQIGRLEESLGHKLFERQGRKLVMTDAGQVVYRYAEEIFLLGREIFDSLRDQPAKRPLRVHIGIAEVIPKLLAKKFLMPVLQMSDDVQLICHENRADRLLAELSIHNLDVVLTDTPVGSLAKVRAYSHLLGESSIMLFAVDSLARKYRRNFPSSLRTAPFLLPAFGTALRGMLTNWFDTHDIRPSIVGEFEDSALLKVFGQQGLGVFAAPVAIRSEVMKQYGVREIGLIEGQTERFYAISVEKKLKHPAVVAIAEAAKNKLFE
jgi:LysR family transcriptional regulator, transcriptional activator of nhaA